MERWLATTKQFEEWRAGLSGVTLTRVHARIDRAHRTGHFGDHHGLKDAEDISEMRLDFGPGYRLYYTTWEYKGHVLLLLLGGDKSTQRRNIKTAKAILADARKRAEREIDEALKKREEEKHGR